MNMNVWAKQGAKVVYSNPQNGYTHDQKQASEHLTVGTTYTVDHTDVGNWHTSVYLTEFPGEAFNSVLFEDAE